MPDWTGAAAGPAEKSNSVLLPPTFSFSSRMVRWARKTLSRKNDYDFDFDCDCDDDCDVCLFDDDDETIVAEENDFE